MKVEWLHVENFRGFENRDFSFSPQFNLIIGDNGLGKTSVLEALAIAIGSWFLGIRGYDGRNIQDRDIRRETIFTDKRFNFKTHLPVVVEAGGIVAGESISWKRELQSDAKRAKTLFKDAIQLKTVAENAYHLARQGNLRLPLIAYYGAGRLWQVPKDTEKSAAVRKKQPQDFDLDEGGESDAAYFTDRFVGYRYSVDNRVNPRFLMRWMAYERRSEIDEEITSFSFRAVLMAIQRALPEVKNVRFSIRHETLIINFNDGRVLPFSDLSDGYRNAITIIGDIAAKAGLLNSHLGKRVLDETDGVVLIDELDLHLHPRWQRRIIEDLRRTFPKIQFICTTHSPFLIQSLQSRDELIVLSDSPEKITQGEDDEDLSGNELVTDDLEHLGVEAIASGIMGVPADASPRYLAMLEAAREYLAELDEAAHSPADRLENYKQSLAKRLAPYADNPAFQAILEAERIDKLGMR